MPSAAKKADGAEAGASTDGKPDEDLNGELEAGRDLEAVATPVAQAAPAQDAPVQGAVSQGAAPPAAPDGTAMDQGAPRQAVAVARAGAPGTRADVPAAPDPAGADADAVSLAGQPGPDGLPQPGTAGPSAGKAPVRAVPRGPSADQTGSGAGTPVAPGSPPDNAAANGAGVPGLGHAGRAHGTATPADMASHGRGAELAANSAPNSAVEPASAAAPSAASPAIPAWATAGLLPGNAAAEVRNSPESSPEANGADRAGPAAQVAPAVVQLAAAPGGGQRMVLRLDPLELGRVEIRVDRGGDGPASVQLTVEKPDTLMLLLRDQSALHKALDLAGLPADRTVQFHLGASAAAGGSHGSGTQSGSGGSNQGWADTPARADGTGLGSGTASSNSNSGSSSGSAGGWAGGASSGDGRNWGSGGQDRGGGWARRPSADDGPAGAPAWLRAGINITA